MSKIPTAEEYLMEKYSLSYDEMSSNRSEDMIEFAKLHVKAAIKECIESAPSGSSTDTVSYEDVVEALKDCYPDKNIK